MLKDFYLLLVAVDTLLQQGYLMLQDFDSLGLRWIDADSGQFLAALPELALGKLQDVVVVA